MSSRISSGEASAVVVIFCINGMLVVVAFVIVLQIYIRLRRQKHYIDILDTLRNQEGESNLASSKDDITSSHNKPVKYIERNLRQTGNNRTVIEETTILDKTKTRSVEFLEPLGKIKSRSVEFLEPIEKINYRSMEYLDSLDKGKTRSVEFNRAGDQFMDPRLLVPVSDSESSKMTSSAYDYDDDKPPTTTTLMKSQQVPFQAYVEQPEELSAAVTSERAERVASVSGMHLMENVPYYSTLTRPSIPKHTTPMFPTLKPITPRGSSVEVRKCSEVDGPTFHCYVKPSNVRDDEAAEVNKYSIDMGDWKTRYHLYC